MNNLYCLSIEQADYLEESAREVDREVRSQFGYSVDMMDFVEEAISKTIQDPEEVFCDECGKEIGLVEYHLDDNGKPICFECANAIEAEQNEAQQGLQDDIMRGIS